MWHSIAHKYVLMYFTIIFIVFFSAYAISEVVNAQPGPSVSDDTYVLISELGPGYTQVDLRDPTPHVQRIFSIFMVVVIVLAVIRLMICGIQYMGSESITNKGESKKCIQYVIGGLLLVFISWILLNTINPDLLSKSLSDI